MPLQIIFNFIPEIYLIQIKHSGYGVDSLLFERPNFTKKIIFNFISQIYLIQKIAPLTVRPQGRVVHWFRRPNFTTNNFQFHSKIFLIQKNSTVNRPSSPLVRTSELHYTKFGRPNFTSKGSDILTSL